MTNKKVKIGSIVMAGLLVVSLVGLFLPFAEILGVNLHTIQLMQWGVQEAGIRGLFASPVVYVTVAVVLLIAALALAVTAIFTGKKVLQDVSGICSLVLALDMLVSTGALVGYWLLFGGSLAAFLCWLACRLDVKEIFRKFIVTLKRRPQLIPMVVFVLGFIVYSFNLTDISDTTALLLGKNMGLSVFAVMLFSMLSLLCFLNTFPYRKKPNYVMMIIMYVMIAIIIFCDVFYLKGIDTILATDAGSKIVIDANNNTFIIYAQYYIKQHIIWLAVGVVLTLLLPVYSKLLRMINTNVIVEGNGEMGAIDISNE